MASEEMSFEKVDGFQRLKMTLWITFITMQNTNNIQTFFIVDRNDLFIFSLFIYLFIT